MTKVLMAIFYSLIDLVGEKKAVDKINELYELV